jgi:hypothetical protein
MLLCCAVGSSCQLYHREQEGLGVTLCRAVPCARSCCGLKVRLRANVGRTFPADVRRSSYLS